MYIRKTKSDHFGECSACGADWNSELLNEYEFAYCPYCGDKREHLNIVDETNNPAREEYIANAKKILVYYFRLALGKNGVPLNHDGVIEIEGIVDDIIEACSKED